MRWKPFAATLALALGLFASTRTIAAGETPAAAAPLANLDFEAGEIGQEPPGWNVPKALKAKGFTVVTLAERPESGARCALLSSPAKIDSPRDFGNLMRSFDATPYRGKRVRFRAAVRVEGKKDSGQLWLRVDRPGGETGFFDNSSDRPILSSSWARYDVVGDVAPDATTVNLGLMHFGTGKAWIDSASFETIGVPGVGDEPARPLAPRGLDNLVAFTRLLGYVRYFHPSDEASRLTTPDWNRFALAGVQAVEKAAGPEELARVLTTLFLPIAPTVRVFPSGRPEPIPAELLAPPQGPEKAHRVAWRHFGVSLGMEMQEGAYRSERITNQAPDKDPDGEPLATVLPEPGQPLRADLGGGVSALVPLALYADAKGALPRVSEVKPRAPEKPEGFLPSGDDRATRLADVALAWNVFQHFYPYFDVVPVDWPAELRRGLTSAAADADARAFRDTLRRLVAALHDGHGNAGAMASPSRLGLPILWEWVENRLVVIQVDREHAAGLGGLRVGDVITAIDGRKVAEVLAAEEALSSAATPQWRRYRAVQTLGLGGPGSVRLAIEHPGGATATVTLERSLPTFGPGTLEEKRPEKIADLGPGILYVDLTRISDDDWKGALDRLAKAKGIVFDFRGYPNGLSPVFLQYLTAEPIHSAQWRIPVVTRPDHQGWTYSFSHWTLEPLTPRLTGKIAFVTDGRAISYAESCMGIVEAYKMGAIVGGPTAGTNGNINPFLLPGGYRLVWTGMQVLKHDGSRHHGVGIQPTVPVSRTLAGVAAGRDELLEKAIEVVSR